MLILFGFPSIKHQKERSDIMNDIMNDTYFKQFVRARRYKESSIKFHRMGLQAYSDFIGKTPTEIIKEAIREEEDGKRMNFRKIKGYFIDFVENLSKKGYSPQTISNRVNSVKTFYHEHDVMTPPRLKLPTSKENPALKKIPSKKDIFKAIKHTNRRNEAIILLMASSGLASAEIRNLKYKDFIKAVEHDLNDLTGNEKLDLTKIQSRLQDKDVVGQWHVIRQKTGMDYITFSTPESILAILDYLKDNHNNNKSVKTMEDYLFSANGNKMKGSTFDDAFQAINDRCGFGKSGYQRFFRSHNLRKFFTNALHNAGMDSNRIEWLLGHKLKKTAASYFKMDVESMKKEYMKYMDAVIIQETKVKIIETEEYKHLISQLMQKQEDIQRLDEEMSLIRGLLSDQNFVVEYWNTMMANI